MSQHKYPDRVAVVFGATGQDGSYLAEHLLATGTLWGTAYRVVGVARRSSTPNDSRVRHLLKDPNFLLVQGDVTDPYSVARVLNEHEPSEIYNLAAQSHVGVSFQEPSHTWQATACGALHILEWLREWHARQPYPCVGPRFYQASSSEMFGSAVSTYDPATKAHGHMLDASVAEAFGLEMSQDETTPMVPNSPYAVAKLAAHHLCRIYRESYGVFACSGILFNHESERRPEQFVTRKIARYVADFARARNAVADRSTFTFPRLKLGNLEARRDWGHAEDYVRAMHLMLLHAEPGDYVVATGETHSVREFLHAAFAEVNETPERAEACVEVDPTLIRPCEVPYLRGDATKAKSVLGWEPRTTFDGLVRRMVLYELTRTT